MSASISHDARRPRRRPALILRRGLSLASAAAACAGAFALAGCADAPRAATTAGQSPAARTLPGLASTAYEQQIAAQGWDLTYQQGDGRRAGTGQDRARGLTVGVVETGPVLPGALTSATCQVRGSDLKADLGFLEACLPSDSLDIVHHWLVTQLTTGVPGDGPDLTFLGRSYHYTADHAHHEHTVRITRA